VESLHGIAGGKSAAVSLLALNDRRRARSSARAD
jgi:hypothetical protein